MLKFRNESWHARLHRQAYADDREWLDHPILGGEWHDKSAEKAVVVRARLDAGRMSICPYFWKTLYALVVYCFVAVPVYAIRNFLRNNWHHVPAFMAGVLIMALIGGVGWVRGDIAALPGKIVERWHARQAIIAAAEAKRAEAERKTRQDAAFLADYYRRHPEALAEKKARVAQWHEEWVKEFERKEAARVAKNWAALIAIMKKAAPWLIGISLAITLLFAYTPLMNLLITAFVLLILIPLERTRWGLALLELLATLFWWWMDLPGRIWHATTNFIRDTWQFLRGYVMAVKERVCPYITFVDGQTTT